MRRAIHRAAIVVYFLLGYSLLYLPWVELDSDVTATPIITGANSINQSAQITPATSTTTFWQDSPAVRNCPAKIEWISSSIERAFQNYRLFGLACILGIASVGVAIILAHRNESLGASRKVVLLAGLTLALASIVAAAFIFPIMSCQPPLTMNIRQVHLVPSTVLIWAASMALGVYSLTVHNRHG